MGQKAKLRKIKKMAYKAKEKNEILEESIESSMSAAELERGVLSAPIKPPYQVILDTNFINDCIRKKMDLEQSLIECLEGEVDLLVPECVFGELEKLGRVYRVALNMIKGLKIETLKCSHKGTYADDCIINRIKEFRCYIVATTDTNLRQRIKKIPLVPVVFFRGHKCMTERFAGGSLY
ncbi:uncharacterized protein VICG_00632 [Vittaforma corneae ATCC 50505]|uniref:PIN domain-containing protein n=1 Tax=Vittaforma corneae (strain ATCC 50505) TaxID=993615 RepID=L2GMW0_VITCO|nr:uncharacterized protein VICG_00632 [Vittaforma corneae ATCC 50505]ELA42233.1 hypothetical protein VICG_00632 [Vittaforma corneae ATCC 50505]